MGVQYTIFVSDEVVELGIHSNVLALFMLLAWQYVMYAN